MATSTWHERELPILEAVRVAEESGDDMEIAARSAVAGLTDSLYFRTMGSLIEDRLLDAEMIETLGGTARVLVEGLKPAGRRAVGQWPSPSDPYEGLLELLDERLGDDSTDEETKSKLQRLRAAMVDVGKGTVSGLLTAYVKGLLPVP